MLTVKQPADHGSGVARALSKTDIFERWLDRLGDQRGRAKILVRIDRLRDGNPGDAGPVGEGTSEMRIHFGPGYRVYYKQVGKSYIILLASDKSSQSMP